MVVAQIVPEQTIPNSEIPRVALRLLASTEDNVARSPGIFTKEDLINIKLYVKKGLALPEKLEEVIVFLGYEKSGIPGLEPVDIKELFDDIREHAQDWEGLQTKVINQSVQLESSSQRIVTTGDTFLSVIDQWPFFQKLQELGEVADEVLEGIQFEEQDYQASLALGQYLDLLKQEISDQKAKTQVVATAVSDYKIALAGGTLSNGVRTSGLEPLVKRKKDLMEKNNLEETIEEYQEEIDGLTTRIDQLKKDYDKFVQLAFTGATGGVIGIAITGGIFGRKAEKARKERNAKIKERRALKAKLSGAQALQRAIDDLADDFDDMGIRMLDAEQALQHLGFMWDTMLQKITESQNQWANVNDGLTLLAFIPVFQNIIDPWREVGDLSGYLIETIDEALEEYKKFYEQQN